MRSTVSLAILQLKTLKILAGFAMVELSSVLSDVLGLEVKFATFCIVSTHHQSFRFIFTCISAALLHGQPQKVETQVIPFEFHL